jgi:hypothetical protein
MFRTVIEESNDGNLLITRQSNLDNGGNAQQRRKIRRMEEAGLLPPVWYKIDRVIVRPGKAIPESAAAWPNMENMAVGVTNDGAQAASDNATMALAGAIHASAVVEAIEKRAAEIDAYNAQPKPRVRAILEEYFV